MINSIRKRLDEREEGFTLIELLVVVIIIGILAAIAIPTFLSQRERAWQAELTSAVRNAALEIESAATLANGTYPVEADGQLLVDAFEDGTATTPLMTLTYLKPTDDPNRFCISGNHTELDATSGLDYNSALGGLQAYEDTGWTAMLVAGCVSVPPATP